MAKTGTLQSDPLFVGLTRPPLFFGVSYFFVLANGAICLLYFINSSNLAVFPIAVVNHLLGYIICFKEPLFIELYLIKGQKCTKCQNKLFHGANSYDPF
jgi:type IV secretion system protein VirB3